MSLRHKAEQLNSRCLILRLIELTSSCLSGVVCTGMGCHLRPGTISWYEVGGKRAASTICAVISDLSTSVLCA